MVAGACLTPWMENPFFRDEGASLYAAHLSWSDLWTQSRVVDLGLLPYYAFLHLQLHVDSGIVWLRMPSLLAFVVTVWVAGPVWAHVWAVRSAES